MTNENSTSSVESRPTEGEGSKQRLRRVRFDEVSRVSDSSAANGILGVAMVGLFGGGPRLTMRAARVVLTDSYASRTRYLRVRRRGD